ncbi:amino acid ABC transporter permease [Herbaspirillum rubrisubalbicans]|uniref:Amino acid ABC transporter permease n=2 Tax=Herbaspirillum rubrisubalbicans TaxID=80842 RepID=A0AAD0U497_9BURK|nr:MULTISPECIES: amino acid ABC transporter permease [Herbaspirillum]ALU87455.1 amino acid ABC transport system, permease component [Herbaspirillum rubrisubalbicans M1]AYR22503.1 amino acid ABC transporter permease [Herbaspirillum rubrisubalbicans]MCP1575587.1 polar amino acid transport system permease protein [Herbaspirillum rubrisubalbicans]NQE50539.1 amino acid ABC transporter permease [Herbaspirillum rubrisubalbicans]QJP98914.1 amino acid ABC transporter permease [Herbaspirillum rubrisubal
MTHEQFLSLLQGAWGTLLLSALTLSLGAMAGLILALARVSPLAAVRHMASAWIQLIQGTPLLVLMGMCFYGPALAGIGTVDALPAAATAMVIYASAFLGEIWRGCIQAVHKSQWEAAECLGLTRWQRMWMIVLPQALRMATPPTVGFAVQVIKNTSVASLVIGFAELSYNAKVINNSTFQPFLYFGSAALLYFAMCYPLSRWSRALERKLHAHHR